MGCFFSNYSDPSKWKLRTSPSTCSAQHSVFNLCPRWGGFCSKPSILGRATELEESEPLRSTGCVQQQYRDLQCLWKPHSAGCITKSDQRTDFRSNSSMSARQRDTVPRRVGATIPTSLLGNVCQLGCTGKGQCKFWGLLQASQRGWTLMGKYYTLFL